MHARNLSKRYRIEDGGSFCLASHDPADTGGDAVSHAEAATLLADGVQRLDALQSLLYPQRRHALLCIVQGMDTAGKDGAIRHVLSGVNPQGVTITAFQAPTEEERAHDFLWRVSRALPRRGQIGIFNRSHYEDVLVARVHPALLADTQEHRHPHMWRHRLADIAAWEAYLARQGIVVLKFFLHISPAEQRRRLLARLDDPQKRWKFSAADIAERACWNDYQHAYQQAIAATAAPHAPWFVVPADHKWFARLVVVDAMIEALAALDLRLPPVRPEHAAALDQARRLLVSEAED